MIENEYSREDLDRVIRKIKHCLALSTSSNEHESAAAMRQAKKLMDKYRLTEMEVEMSDVGHTFGAVAKTRLKHWESDLAQVVSDVFDCRAIQYQDVYAGRKRVRMMFTGVSPAQDIAVYAFDTLHTKLTHDRRLFVGGLRPDKRRRDGPQVRGDHFARAWIWAVADKLRALVPQAEDDIDASGERALMVVRQRGTELIDAYLNQVGNLTSITYPKRKANDDDLRRGFAAGRKAEVNHGVTTAGTGPAQIAGGL
jgi:hypothetical protein